jgi:hypothetical protein
VVRNCSQPAVAAAVVAVAFLSVVAVAAIAAVLSVPAVVVVACAAVEDVAAAAWLSVAASAVWWEAALEGLELETVTGLGYHPDLGAALVAVVASVVSTVVAVLFVWGAALVPHRSVMLEAQAVWEA